MDSNASNNPNNPNTPNNNPNTPNTPNGVVPPTDISTARGPLQITVSAYRTAEEAEAAANVIQDARTHSHSPTNMPPTAHAPEFTVDASHAPTFSATQAAVASCVPPNLHNPVISAAMRAFHLAYPRDGPHPNVSFTVILRPHDFVEPPTTGDDWFLVVTIGPGVGIWHNASPLTPDQIAHMSAFCMQVFRKWKPAVKFYRTFYKAGLVRLTPSPGHLSSSTSSVSSSPSSVSSATVSSSAVLPASTSAEVASSVIPNLDSTAPLPPVKASIPNSATRFPPINPLELAKNCAPLPWGPIPQNKFRAVFGGLAPTPSSPSVHPPAHQVSAPTISSQAPAASQPPTVANDSPAGSTTPGRSRNPIYISSKTPGRQGNPIYIPSHPKEYPPIVVSPAPPVVSPVPPVAFQPPSASAPLTHLSTLLGFRAKLGSNIHNLQPSSAPPSGPPALSQPASDSTQRPTLSSNLTRRVKPFPMMLLPPQKKHGVSTTSTKAPETNTGPLTRSQAPPQPSTAPALSQPRRPSAQGMQPRRLGHRSAQATQVNYPRPSMAGRRALGGDPNVKMPKFRLKKKHVVWVESSDEESNPNWPTYPKHPTAEEAKLLKFAEAWPNAHVPIGEQSVSQVTRTIKKQLLSLGVAKAAAKIPKRTSTGSVKLAPSETQSTPLVTTSPNAADPESDLDRPTKKSRPDTPTPISRPSADKSNKGKGKERAPRSPTPPSTARSPTLPSMISSPTPPSMPLYLRMYYESIGSAYADPDEYTLPGCEAAKQEPIISHVNAEAGPSRPRSTGISAHLAGFPSPPTSPPPLLDPPPPEFIPEEWLMSTDWEYHSIPPQDMDIAPERTPSPDYLVSLFEDSCK